MLEAGPELDKLVADAIGLTATIDADVCDPHPDAKVAWIEVLSEGRRVFSPSTDLNAAFWAAEKVNFPFSLTRNSGGEYLVVSIDPRIGVGDGWHDTPALAICAAILKLKGHTDA